MDAFISHVQEDAQIAKAVADGLERAGYTTWYYERDTDFRPFTEQVYEALVKSRVFVLIISKNSIKSHQVTAEVAQAQIQNRIFIPLLYGITWEEFEQLGQRQWLLAIGAAAALEINLENLPSVLPRIFSGLESMGIFPESRSQPARNYNLYPEPIAAVYERVLKRAGTRYQELQVHEGLKDIPNAVVRFLAVLVLSDYRKQYGPGNEDADIEAQLKNLGQARLLEWVNLLHTLLGLYLDSSDELIRQIYTFFSAKTQRNNAISEAVLNIREWVGSTAQSKQPFSFEDFFELSAVYENQANGWGSREAALSPGEYEKRNQILREAYEKLLADLEFLTAYRLIYVNESGSAAHARLYDATGPRVVPLADPSLLSKGLEPGHVYFCQPTSGQGLEPSRDLYPLLVCQECVVCRSLNMFFPGPDAKNQMVLTSYGCGHSRGMAVQRQKEIEKFLSTSEWRVQAPESAALHQPYIAALREMLREGPISPDNRTKLDFLARILNIEPEVQNQLQEQVQAEMALANPAPEPAAPEPAMDTAEPDLTPPIEPQAGEAVEAAEESEEPEKSEEPAAPVPEAECETSPQNLELLWRETFTDSLACAGFFGSQPCIFGVDCAGMVKVLTTGQQMLYQESVETRPYAFLAAGDSVMLSTWEGSLYCFGPREMLWQAAPGNLVSVLAPAQDGAFLAGLWDGRIILYEKDGRVRWTAEMNDGVSCLAVSADGAFIAAGSYGGQLQIFDTAGKARWMRDLGSGITRLAFASHKNDLFVASRDFGLLHIRVDDQHIYWRKNLGMPILELLVSANDRRLWTSGSDHRICCFNKNDDLHLRGDYSLPGVKGGQLYPFSKEGSLACFYSSTGGLVFVDHRKKLLTCETDAPVDGAAISADGKYTLAYGKDGLDLFALKRPELKASVQAVDALRLGSFTRVLIRLKNTGQRGANMLKLELEGPFQAMPFTCPDHLAAGASLTLENLSLQPLSEGAIPVSLKITYQDDLGIDYQQDELQILDTAARPPIARKSKENPK